MERNETKYYCGELAFLNNPTVNVENLQKAIDNKLVTVLDQKSKDTLEFNIEKAEHDYFHKAVGHFDTRVYDAIEKAKKDFSRLAMRRITDKNGKSTIVYVKVNDDPKTGKQKEFDVKVGQDVHFQLGDGVYAGTVKSLKFNDKTDKFGTATISYKPVGSTVTQTKSVSLNKIMTYGQDDNTKAKEPNKSKKQSTEEEQENMAAKLDTMGVEVGSMVEFKQAVPKSDKMKIMQGKVDSFTDNGRVVVALSDGSQKTILPDFITGLAGEKEKAKFQGKVNKEDEAASAKHGVVVIDGKSYLASDIQKVFGISEKTWDGMSHITKKKYAMEYSKVAEVSERQTSSAERKKAAKKASSYDFYKKTATAKTTVKNAAKSKSDIKKAWDEDDFIEPKEALMINKGYNIAYAYQPFDFLPINLKDELLKGNLVKKIITDKNGHKTTRWVSPEQAKGGDDGGGEKDEKMELFIDNVSDLASKEDIDVDSDSFRDAVYEVWDETEFGGGQGLKTSDYNEGLKAVKIKMGKKADEDKDSDGISPEEEAKEHSKTYEELKKDAKDGKLDTTKKELGEKIDRDHDEEAKKEGDEGGKKAEEGKSDSGWGDPEEDEGNTLHHGPNGLTRVKTSEGDVKYFKDLGSSTEKELKDSEAEKLAGGKLPTDEELSGEFQTDDVQNPDKEDSIEQGDSEKKFLASESVKELIGYGLKEETILKFSQALSAYQESDEYFKKLGAKYKEEMKFDGEAFKDVVKFEKNLKKQMASAVKSGESDLTEDGKSKLGNRDLEIAMMIKLGNEEGFSELHDKNKAFQKFKEKWSLDDAEKEDAVEDKKDGVKGDEGTEDSNGKEEYTGSKPNKRALSKTLEDGKAKLSFLQSLDAGSIHAIATAAVYQTGEADEKNAISDMMQDHGIETREDAKALYDWAQKNVHQTEELTGLDEAKVKEIKEGLKGEGKHYAHIKDDQDQETLIVFDDAAGSSASAMVDTSADDNKGAKKQDKAQ